MILLTVPTETNGLSASPKRTASELRSIAPSPTEIEELIPELSGFTTTLAPSSRPLFTERTPKTTKTSSALEARNVFSTCSRTVTLPSFRSCLGPPIREELPAARIIAEITPDETNQTLPILLRYDDPTRG